MVITQNDTSPQQTPPVKLLPPGHTILERPLMEFRPFGVDEQGNKIRDTSGVSVAATVQYLEQVVTRDCGREAGAQVVLELCRLLNERIRDPVYHVTPSFLKNAWHSYSAEAVSYLYEFCERLSGDPLFAFHAGQEKASPVLQVLARPFALSQIYGMFPYFAEKYGALECRVVKVSNTSAILAMKFPERICRQFGPYLKRCAYGRCQAAKGIMTAVPERVHGLPPATVVDRACIARGDEWCEWEITWAQSSARGFVRRLWGGLVGFVDSSDRSQEGKDLNEREVPSSFSRQPPRPVGSTSSDPTEPQEEERPELLSKDHTILERPFMLYRPFGVDRTGRKIQDFSGVMVRDNVEYLQECVRRSKGPEAAKETVEELCRLLNQRIRDSAYHVTPSFLATVWNSYSYEFASYLREFCRQLSGDPNFHYSVGREKHISPLIQTLGRPFSLSQVHKMYPYFAQKFARGVECTLVEMTECSAVLRLKFAAHVERQFGPYRKACAAMTCESSKGRIAMVPLRLHNLPMSTVTDRRCIVNGDECCEWEVRWSPEPARRTGWSLWGTIAGASAFVYLRAVHPAIPSAEALVIAVLPVLVAWLSMSRRVRQEAFKREALIQEQVKFVEARHEELREAYLEQEQTRVQLRRKVNQLTALHQAGLLFNATLDRETLLSNVLHTLVEKLHYDRAMITFYDPVRRVSGEARVIGVTPEVQAFARSREIPVSDPDTVEGMVLLQGKPLLIGDIRDWVDRMHPLNRKLAALTGTKSVIAVPLKTKDRILGSLTVDRMQEHSLNEDDLELMVTLANQVVIALDNVSAYRQIEELNVGLEAKVRERTAELEQADRLRTLFLRHVSHELRTPLTSMKGFIENMLDGLTGPLTEKQRVYLTRILDNEGRLIRMIEDLLDRTRIETGRLELSPSNVDLDACLAEVIEHLRPLAEAKRQTLEVSAEGSLPPVWADRDRLIQIVVNLVQNAIKFTPDGGQIVVTTVAADEHFAGIRVQDTGPGIPQDCLEKIFDPFFRVTQGQKGGPKGLGLGLSITKTLVELHGGSIKAQSGEGEGAELFFTIPFVPDTAGRPQVPGSGTKCVLVVDDDLDLQKMLSDRLAATGYRVQTVGDGRQAVEAIRTRAFTGVLLDIGLPHVDGIDVLRRIRQESEDVPVVVMTAWGTQQLAVQAISMGAQAYVLKPFDLAELRRVLDTWFGSIERRDS